MGGGGRVEVGWRGLKVAGELVVVSGREWERRGAGNRKREL